MILSLRIAVLVMAVLLALVYMPLPSHADECPGCYRNEQGLRGSYGRNDVTGDELVTVQLNLGNDDAGVNGKIQQAIGDAEQPGSALNQWNTARGTNAQKSGSWFFINQNVSNPNIVIRRGDASGNCMQTATNVDSSGRIIYPIVITIPDSTAQKMSLVDLTAAIMHELGHCQGLADTYDDRVCNTRPSGSSIMQPSKAPRPGQPTCSAMQTTSIKPADVDFARTHRDTYLLCQKTKASGPSFTGIDCTAAEAECQQRNGTWNASTCTCSSGCDQEQNCLNQGGAWDAGSCTCTYSCDPSGSGEANCLAMGGNWDPSTCTCNAAFCVPGPIFVVDRESAGSSWLQCDGGYLFVCDGTFVTYEQDCQDGRVYDTWVEFVPACYNDGTTCGGGGGGGGGGDCYYDLSCWCYYYPDDPDCWIE